MTLFKWSTPERRKGDDILLVIPNEVYLDILEHVVPHTRCLTPEGLATFTNLSLVCRFFANVCLPRIFEFVEFSGSIFHDDMHTTYKPSRGATLCAQIAAKQPLALSLAKTVKACHFTNWRREGTGSWVLRPFAKKYLTGMLHMNNVRELKFSRCFVYAEHWDAIGALGSLEELSFLTCDFVEGPADVEPEKRIKVKVFHLHVTNCTGYRHPIAAIDPEPLRTLTADLVFVEQADWLPRSALTKVALRTTLGHPSLSDVDQVHVVLTQIPQSVETLWLSIDDTSNEPQCRIIPVVFTESAWKNFPLLRSLELQLFSDISDRPVSVISSALEVVGLLQSLQSLTLQGFKFPGITSTEIQRILHDKVDPASSLIYAYIYGKAFRLVDGKWVANDHERRHIPSLMQTSSF